MPHFKTDVVMKFATIFALRTLHRTKPSEHCYSIVTKFFLVCAQPESLDFYHVFFLSGLNFQLASKRLLGPIHTWHKILIE